MNFIVYSKDGCPYCDKIKYILNHVCQNENYNLTVYNLNNDFNRDEFYLKFGEGSTFPQVIFEENKLGGCIQTIEYLQENKLI